MIQKMKQYQINSRPRHLRYLFFVYDQIPYEKLFDLISSNIKIWGGRYNPIIPVSDNKISDRYIEVIKNYDPDFIFYSKEIDKEMLKQLRFFNPIGYFNMDDEPPSEKIDSVDKLYLLSQFDRRNKIIVTQDLWKIKSNLFNYFKLNFGLEQASFLSDFQITKDFKQIIIDPSNFDSLHKIIYEEKPINQSLLCARNINTKLLRNLVVTNYNEFELIIAKDTTSKSDLLYYWNRILFECYCLFYITVDELDLLKNDEYFGKFLYSLSINNQINVVSFSLTQEELNDQTNILKTIVLHREIKIKKIKEFPFEILDALGIHEKDYGESISIQTLLSDKGLYQLPPLSFTKNVSYYPQRWAIDLSIKKAGENYQSEIKFPLTTDTDYIVRRTRGRINLKRDISIIVHNQATDNQLEVYISELHSRLNQLITSPVLQGEIVQSKFCEIGPNDSSNKLLAFLKLFDFDFHTIRDFFTDIFWVHLFEYLCTNDKSVGDSIQFDDIIERIIIELDRSGVKLGLREETHLNRENLESSLKRTLKELSEYKVFFKGFKLKCPKCSSEFWYHINETCDVITCKGCLEIFELPIEPKFSYKLNDLVKNNIYQTKKDRDGNLTVIRTLSYLCNQSRISFEFNPQINLYNNLQSNKPESEIDIVCISDGEFVIGEAKHSSLLFSQEKYKSLNSLVDIARNIHPDKIILSCYEDHNNRLERAKKYIMHLFNGWEYQPIIETLILDAPDDFELKGYRYFYF
jgi:hypothetical protein